MLKINFENSNKSYDFKLETSENSSFLEQHKAFLESCDYENIEIRSVHHLYNPETYMYILSCSDFKSSKNNSCNIFLRFQ